MAARGLPIDFYPYCFSQVKGVFGGVPHFLRCDREVFFLFLINLLYQILLWFVSVYKKSLIPCLDSSENSKLPFDLRVFKICYLIKGNSKLLPNLGF